MSNIRIERVLVVVVLIADIKRRIGEDKVHKRFFDFAQQVDTVAADDLILKFTHVRIIAVFTVISSGKQTKH